MNNGEHNPYDTLTSPQQIAVDLRLAGKVYKDIASHEFINLQEHTIRTWFMQGGVCHATYEWKKKIRAEERELYYRDEIESEMKDIGRDAMVALREAISKGNTTAIVKALEFSGISKMSYNIQVQQEDEGILILREMIESGRKEAREKREQSKNDQTQNDQTQIKLRAL